MKLSHGLEYDYYHSSRSMSMRTYRSPVTLPLRNMRDELMEPDWYGYIRERRGEDRDGRVGNRGERGGLGGGG